MGKKGKCSTFKRHVANARAWSAPRRFHTRDNNLPVAFEKPNEATRQRQKPYLPRSRTYGSFVVLCFIIIHRVSLTFYCFLMTCPSPVGGTGTIIHFWPGNNPPRQLPNKSRPRKPQIKRGGHYWPQKGRCFYIQFLNVM